MESWYSIRRAGPRCGWHTRLATCKPYCRAYKGRPRRESPSPKISQCAAQGGCLQPGLPPPARHPPPPVCGPRWIPTGLGSTFSWATQSTDNPTGHIFKHSLWTQIGPAAVLTNFKTLDKAQWCQWCWWDNSLKYDTIGRTSNAKKMSGKENDKVTASINDSPKRQNIAAFTMNVKWPCSPHIWNY